MNLFAKILSIFSPDKIITNIHAENSFTKNLNDKGVFEYHENGFTVCYKDFSKELAWDDITQINVFKTDMITIDRVDMEIVYGDKAFTISEDLPGWYLFVTKIKEIFPSIPLDWDITIVQPAFARNYKTIYIKQKPFVSVDEDINR